MTNNTPKLHPLSLRKAVELYRILAPHLPQDLSEETPALSYVQQTIDSMKEKDKDAYLQAILLMTNLDVTELAEKDSMAILELFIEGLSVNEVALLVTWCKGLGLNYG